MRKISLVLIALLLMHCGWAAENFQSIRLVFAKAGPNVYQSHMDTLDYVLENPDDPDHPTVWEGPFRIVDKTTNAQCTADVALITNVYAIPDHNLAVVLSYSGSMTYIDFLDARTCKSRYPRIEAYSEGICVNANRVEIQPACEKISGNIYQCASGKIYYFGLNQAPKLSESESIHMTKSILKVGFIGERKVFGPRTSEARIVVK